MMTAPAATAAYWRRMGRALMVGGAGCALAGAAFLILGPARVSGTRTAFAALVLAYGVGSVTAGIILRRRHRGAPQPQAVANPD